VTGFEPATTCPPDKCATTALHPVPSILEEFFFLSSQKQLFFSKNRFQRIEKYYTFSGLLVLCNVVMVLVIDAFNLIYKFPDLEMLMYQSDLAEARRGLVEKLLSYKRIKRKEEIHLFFDGRKEMGSPVQVDSIGELKIYYSIDLKADELIKQFIKKNPNPGNLFVVSSDKDIIFYSKRYLCKSYTSEAFQGIIEKTLEQKESRNQETDRIHKELDPKELNYWLKMFKERKNGK
jgi:uncharacterized protein